MYEYYNLEKLPDISARRRCLQTSSYDKKYENADFGNYLYEEDGEYVLFDEVGCGCIKSIWMAVTSDETVLNFYFDGADAPRWTATTKGLFNGVIPELRGFGNTFLERGHYEEDDCHAGNLFIQIPYEKGLRITAIGRRKVYYHILYETYSEGKPEIKETDAFAAAFENRRPEYRGEEITVPMRLKRGYNDIIERKGAGVIRRFTVRYPVGTDISKVRFQAYFDDLRPAVMECPLEMLFASPVGFSEIETLAVSSHEKDGIREMSFYLPILWWERVSLCLVNRTTDFIEGVEVSMTICENTYDKATSGYLCADTETGDTQLFSDWHFGRFRGRGHVVGLVQSCYGDQYCEGNEHFYINGEVSPSVNGTGTEDLYLGCYWPNSKYDSPVAGCVNDVWLENGRDIQGAFKAPYGYYRFFLDEPIAFDNGIVLDIQHGAVCQTYSEYSSTVFSYRQDAPRLIETDMINVSAESSRKMHSYENSGKEYSLRAKIESDMRAQLIERSGYKADGECTVSFRIALSKDNCGAVLRRLYDQTLTNKGAKVYVDGELAGVWNCANENEFFAFCDSDFIIPSKFTKGKDNVEIRIEPENLFTDFEYRVFCYTE